MKINVPEEFSSDFHEFSLTSMNVADHSIRIILESEQFDKKVELTFGDITWVEYQDLSKILEAINNGDDSCVEIVSLGYEKNVVKIILSIYNFVARPVFGYETILKFEGRLIDNKIDTHFTDK